MATQKVSDDPRFCQRRIIRFWSQVDTSGGPDACWPWTGGTTHSGHGKVCFFGLKTTTHRVAYALCTGQEIPADLKGLHSCDYPPCCNPKHVSPGTQTINLAQMRARGRGYKFPVIFGENAPHAKLSDVQIAEMRALRARYPASWTERALAERFSIGSSQVHRILRGESRAATADPC